MSSIENAAKRAGDELAIAKEEQLDLLSTENRSLSKELRKLKREMSRLENSGALTKEDQEILHGDLTDQQKITEMKNILVKFSSAFSFENIPNDYKTLAGEAKYLSNLSGLSFLYMAKRLLKIRDEKLFISGGFNDFKTFVTDELGISKSTAYEYIDICEYFVESARADSTLELIVNNKTKVRAFIPLLKSDKLTADQKNEIRSGVIEELSLKSYRELNDEAKELKKVYGLTKTTEPNRIKTSLAESLSLMYESIKRLNSEKSDDAFLLMVELLEIDNKITTKELQEITDGFKAFKLEEEI